MSTATLLYDACLFNKPTEVRQLLGASCDVNTQNSTGQTALFAACIGGNKEIVKLLLSYGAELNHQDASGQTPLHVAFHNDNIVVARQLCNEYHASTTVRDEHQRTALHVAIKKGHLAGWSELLLQNLADDIGTQNSWLQLHAASYVGDAHKVDLLLENATPLDERNDDDCTALVIACKQDNAFIVSRLLNGKADPDLPDKDHNTALHHAVRREHSGIAESLLRSNANTSIQDSDGDCALHLAVQRKAAGLVDMLLRHGADPNSFGKQMATPLYIACRQHSSDIVRVLLQHSADANQLSPEGLAPLHVAVHEDHAAIVRLLLEHGARPNEQGHRGSSILHLAVSEGASTDTMIALLEWEKPCIINLADQDGDTPLHLAALSGKAYFVNLLLRYGAKRSCRNKQGLGPFEMAVRKHRFDVIRLFIEDGYDIDCNLISGETLLYYCCNRKNGQTEIVNLLLQRGIDVNQLCSRGSALDAALDNGSVDIVQKLIQAGASVTKVSRKHSSALDRLYAHRDYYGYILKLIIENAPNDEAQFKDSNGETLFLKACRDGATDIFDWLIQSGKDIGVNARNKLGHSPVYVLCDKKRACLLSQLLNAYTDIDVDAADHQQLSPLHIACKHGDLFTINMLLRKSRQSLEAKDKLDRRPAHFVSRQEVLPILTKWGVDLSCENYLGQTPLLTYCLDGNIDMVSAVTAIDRTQVKSCDRMGRNIIHLCVEKRHHAIVEHAVGLGLDLDLDAKDINGQTGLHLAARNDDPRATELLLQHGANPNVADKSGLTPLLFARSAVHDLLRSCGAAADCVSSRGCDYDTMHSWREQVHDYHTTDFFRQLVQRGESFMEEIIKKPLVGLIQGDPNQDREFHEVKAVLRDFMNKLSTIVAEKDPLMEFAIMPSGSMNEETKVGIPDEGDFVCILPKVSAQLKPPSKFIFHTTYVTLSASDDDAAHQLTFVDESGKVLTRELFHRFYEAVGLALADPRLWEEFPFLYRAMADDITGHHDKISNVTLYFHGAVYKWTEVSVDVVPAVYFDGWQPPWCEQREVLETAKCCIVAKDIKHAPEEKRKYLFQLCFTECDAAMFRMMIPELKQGYMIAKLVRQPQICSVIYENELIPLEPVSKYISSYMLKTATYQVFEDFKQDPKNFHFAGETSMERAGIACARMIYDKLEEAFSQNYLEMFFVPAYDIFRNHYESRHDLEVAKMYCGQIRNILSMNPKPHKITFRCAGFY